MSFWKVAGLAPLALAALLAIGLAAAFALPEWSPPDDPGLPRAQDGQLIPRLDAPTLARLTRRLDADPTVARFLKMCPADVWRRRGDKSRAAIPLAVCGENPQKCLTDCLEFSNGNACFSLAAVLQEAHDLDPLYGEKLYQMACASGDSAGCVNRAAGLRNTTYPGDPYPKRPVAAREVCQFRSFSLACDDGDAWGCTMRGQARERGEGVRKNAAAARRDYAKACKPDPEFAACVYKKAPLAGLGRPK